MMRRQPCSPLSSSSAASDVYKRQVPENGNGSACNRPVVIIEPETQHQDNTSNNIANTAVVEEDSAEQKKSSFARKVARRRSSMHFLEATIESLSNSACLLYTSPSPRDS
eukprot:TRINITY_DN49684_c0_g1_i1.p1 TRINITY_DN49684_c0_g1~~TRINITY_DN49684_c0_g1_i1.p1  ORF type:complete len:110 (+),score=24.41 TRINITY_DN49684_c0_g1_i1:119-448(+)